MTRITTHAAVLVALLALVGAPAQAAHEFYVTIEGKKQSEYQGERPSIVEIAAREVVIAAEETLLGQKITIRLDLGATDAVAAALGMVGDGTSTYSLTIDTYDGRQLVTSCHAENATLKELRLYTESTPGAEDATQDLRMVTEKVECNL